MEPKYISYVDKTWVKGTKPKQPLREIKELDRKWLIDCMRHYLLLEDILDNPKFTQWFNSTNNSLPRQPQQFNAINSPKSLAEGILSKLTKNGYDLSPQQHDGIMSLSQLFEQKFKDADLFREVIFELHDDTKTTTTYKDIFG